MLRSLLHGRGYELAVPAEQERRLTLDVLLAIQEGYDILKQRQEGRLVEPALTDTPPLPAAWEPAPATGGAGLGWQELIAHWKADRRRALRTELEVEAIVGALRAFLPQSRPGTVTPPCRSPSGCATNATRAPTAPGRWRRRAHSSGARLDEIGSLLVENIQLDPVPHFSITAARPRAASATFPCTRG